MTIGAPTFGGAPSASTSWTDVSAGDDPAQARPRDDRPARTGPDVDELDARLDFWMRALAEIGRIELG